MAIKQCLKACTVLKLAHLTSMQIESQGGNFQMIFISCAYTAFLFKKLYLKCLVIIVKSISLTSYVSRLCKRKTTENIPHCKDLVTDYNSTNFSQIFKTQSLAFISQNFPQCFLYLFPCRHIFICYLWSFIYRGEILGAQ